MREQLEALAKELRDLKREGVESVYIADDTFSSLERMLPKANPGDSVAKVPPLVQDKAVVAAAFKQETREAAPVAFPAVKKKRAIPVHVSEIPSAPDFVLPDADKQSQWDFLKKKVMEDRVCNQQKAESKNLVFGAGNLDADIFFYAETPGETEESKADVFVGDAGLLLSKIIKAMGLSRDSVYLTYVMQWKPKNDSPISKRVTAPEEIEYCLPYFKAQLDIVKPKVIVALGNTAVSALLGADPSRKLGKIRGQFMDYENTSLLPSFHPSYVLEYGTQKVKRQIWEDMLLVMEKVGLAISDKQRGFFK